MIYFFFLDLLWCVWAFVNYQQLQQKNDALRRKLLGLRTLVFFRVISPITRRFQYFKTINLIYIISCSLFCSLKETSPQTVGAEGGVGGVSWKLYKFWSSSHLYLHSWTMQHYRKRPRNYGLIMVLEKYLWSQLCFWFILI